MPPVQNPNEQAVHQMTEAFNTGNLSIVDQLIDPAHVDQTPFPNTTPDRDGLKAQITALRRAFPDVKFSIDKIVSSGDTVAYRWKLVGTHKGPLMGHPPTNKQVTHFGNDFVTFSNGKIVEHHSADNLSELLQQLGLQSSPFKGPTP